MRSERNLIRILLLLTCLMLSSGCTNLFFVPDSYIYSTPKQFNLEHREYFIPNETHKERIHSWLITKPKQDFERLVIQLHGNAQNLSSHYANLAWLLNHQYALLAIDYQGYGLSYGTASVENALEDIQRILNYVIENQIHKGKPIILFGQSLGAALALTYSGMQAQHKTMLPVNLVIAESPFYSYSKIASDAMKKSWVSYPFAVFSHLIEDEYSPINYIKKINKPVIIAHSQADQIIPYYHSKILYKNLSTNSFFISTNDTLHIQTWRSEKNQKRLLEQINKLLHK